MSRKLKDLQAEWSKKLAESGFKDIEICFEYHSQIFKRKARQQNVMMDENQAYYQKAAEFLNEYEFNSLEEHQIWMLHVQGESCRKIELSLNQRKLKKSTINNIIQRLKKIMLTSY